MAEGDVHVMPSDNGRRVETEGSSHAGSTHQTQPEAKV
jgi:hypothetical protein